MMSQSVLTDKSSLIVQLCYCTLQFQLQEKNEQLYTRLEEMQTRYSELMNSKTQLSSKLISSEEEKLQVRDRYRLYLRVAL